MGRAMVRLHVLRLLSDVYVQWKQFFPHDSEEGREVHVPLRYLRMAHEIISENDELQLGKEE